MEARGVEYKVKYSWRYIGNCFVDRIIFLRRIYFPCTKYVQSSVETSLGVTTGHPDWMVFQSRVLGPYIIKALSFGSLDNYAKAYASFQITTVAIAAFLCWRLGRKYGGNDQSALLALALFVICFIWLLSPPFLYSWDFIDIIVFILFIDFVLSGMSLRWFIGLFAIAIWNRDSAIFIALWLILDPLVRFFHQRRYRLQKIPLGWHRILAGVFCIGAGLIIVELLKRNLLIEEMGPKLYPSSPITGGNRYNLVLQVNIDFLKKTFNYKAWIYTKIWIVAPFLATVIVLGANLVRIDPQRYLSIYLIELGMLATLLLFGLLYETRVLLILIPFVVISGVLVSGSRYLGRG